MHISTSFNILFELSLSRNSLLTSYFTIRSEFHEEFRFESDPLARERIESLLRIFVTKKESTKRHYCCSSYSKTLQTTLYPNRAHVFLLGRPAVSTALPIYPLHDVPGALRGRYDVERRRDGSTLFEIADPEFAPREFPLDVGAFLITSTPNCPAN